MLGRSSVGNDAVACSSLEGSDICKQPRYNNQDSQSARSVIPFIGPTATNYKNSLPDSPSHNFEVIPSVKDYLVKGSYSWIVLAPASYSSNMAFLPICQSARKEDFLQALKINLSHGPDREAFNTMWEEVTQYWVRHFETTSRHILKPEYARNPGVKQPYKWGHLCTVAIDRAIDEIWQASSELSRYYYDIGSSTDKSVHNWVLKWLLWHVARYRDERNNKKNRTPDGSLAPSSYSSPINVRDCERDQEAGQMEARDYLMPNYIFQTPDPLESSTFRFDFEEHVLQPHASDETAVTGADPPQSESIDRSVSEISSLGEVESSCQRYWDIVLGGRPES